MWALALGSLALAAGLAGLLLRRRRMKPHKYGRLVTEVGDAQPSAEGRPAVGPTYRNVVATEGYATLEGVRTLYELFQSSAEKYADNPCLGHRPQVRLSCWPGAYI
jgi:hypothetical protein